MNPDFRSQDDRPEPSILVVDDERSFVASLEHALRREGYRVSKAFDGPSALATFTREKPDVVLLDLMLPGTSGLEVCRSIRQSQEPQPGIIMVTAKDTDMDAVIGLESGADDYVTKPFNLGILLARIRALLRRQKRASQGGRNMRRLVLGDIEIDTASYELTCKGNHIDLSPRLFGLLQYLAENQGQVVTRDELLNRIWGYEYAGETRTVDVHIHWLREHLNSAGCTSVAVQTIRGVGYKLVVTGAHQT